MPPKPTLKTSLVYQWYEKKALEQRNRIQARTNNTAFDEPTIKNLPPLFPNAQNEVRVYTAERICRYYQWKDALAYDGSDDDADATSDTSQSIDSRLVPCAQYFPLTSNLKRHINEHFKYRDQPIEIISAPSGGASSVQIEEDEQFYRAVHNGHKNRTHKNYNQVILEAYQKEEPINMQEWLPEWRCFGRKKNKRGRQIVKNEIKQEDVDSGYV
jgi:hypothetical protein